MARPRREAGVPEGRDRLIAAFWSLLEDRELSDVTVGALAEAAGCNRGTFYYHFESLDALVHAAIEAEILTEHTFSHSILEIMISTEDDTADAIWRERRFNHIELLIRRGGLELVGTETKAVLVAIWTRALHPGGGELSQRTRYILEYSMSGALGMMTLAYGNGDHGLETFPAEFAQHAARFVLAEISASEGIPVDEIIARMQRQIA